MSVLSWGKPKVEFGLLGASDAAPTTFTEITPLVQDSTKLTTTKGTERNAIGEGGELIDTANEKSGYTLELEIFFKKGATKPISDTDGVIDGYYAVRLTPEDNTVEGFIIDKSKASVEETWDAKNGKKLKYTFKGLIPTTGAILKSYTYTAPAG